MAYTKEKKPENKCVIVKICAKFDVSSINKTLLSRSDFKGQIVPVLLRLTKEQATATVTEAMFHQVITPEDNRKIFLFLW